MLLSDALSILQNDLVLRENERRPLKLAIKIYQPGTIGGTPRVAVSRIDIGFDWDAGTIFLQPETPLTSLSAEDVENIRVSAAKGQSWHAYQSHKKMAEKVKALEGELNAVKAELARLALTSSPPIAEENVKAKPGGGMPKVATKKNKKAAPR